MGSSAQLEINPALQAGLNAAYVPHAPSWNKDDAELHSGAGKLLIVSSFRFEGCGTISKRKSGSEYGSVETQRCVALFLRPRARSR